jgi:hypothetical protein
MEFIEAPKISQIDAMSDLGLDPPEVARVLCEVFSDMMFCHGFVHCDPHAGNIFVRRNPDPRVQRKEQIVLLDHGLYRELDDEFRKTYCDLWRAMLMRDNALLEDCGRRLNVGELAKYLPLLFTYRPISHKGRLDAAMSEPERQKLSEDLKNVRFSNVRRCSRPPCDVPTWLLTRLCTGFRLLGAASEGHAVRVPDQQHDSSAEQRVGRDDQVRSVRVEACSSSRAHTCRCCCWAQGEVCNHGRLRCERALCLLLGFSCSRRYWGLGLTGLLVGAFQPRVPPPSARLCDGCCPVRPGRAPVQDQACGLAKCTSPPTGDATAAAAAK